jgi:D-alanyl-D-alanine carboxypeptidase
MCIAIESELDNGKTCGGLMVQSGYLTYDQQVELYESNPETLEGDLPGHSEHQLGTAFDFAVKGVNQSQFADTVQYQWLSENGHRFGFIQSYPEGKENVTQKQARPWHWRYVGYELAADLYFNQLTLFEAAYE